MNTQTLNTNNSEIPPRPDSPVERRKWGVQVIPKMVLDKYSFYKKGNLYVRQLEQHDVIYEVVYFYVKEVCLNECLYNKNISTLIDRFDLVSLTEILVPVFRSGLVKHNYWKLDTKSLKVVLRRLLLNRLRRDSNLNGHYMYNKQLRKPRNWYPHPELESLKHLLSRLSDPEKISMVESYKKQLEKRLKTLKKSKKYKFDINDLPVQFRGLV